jgi:hypothetical protein
MYEGAATDFFGIGFDQKEEPDLKKDGIVVGI